MRYFLDNKLTQGLIGAVSATLIIAIVISYFPGKISKLETNASILEPTPIVEEINIPYFETIDKEKKSISWKEYEGKKFWYYEVRNIEKNKTLYRSREKTITNKAGITKHKNIKVFVATRKN